VTVEVVIDCCVLQAALGPDLHLDALCFVTDVLKKPHVIAVDHQKKIEGEYRRYFHRVSRLYDAVVAELLTTPGKTYYRDGKLSAAASRKLTSLQCHLEDRPYIAVAANSADGRIASNDGRSILHPDIRSYLESELGLKVFGLPEIPSALKK
jgi:hypothetical protein